MHAVKWTKTIDELPAGNVGDRIVLVVCERDTPTSPWVNRLVILEVLEDGWESPDPVYAGYTPGDGELWAWERSIIGTAEDE